MANRLVTRREFVLLCFIAGSILVGSGVAVWTERQGRTVVEKAPAVADAGEVAPPPEIEPVAARDETQVSAGRIVSAPVEPVPKAEILVEVAGAVERPGIYRFAVGATVADAIEKAGGPADDADFADLNRAATLLPATRLTIPHGRSSARVDGKVVVTIPGRVNNIPAYRIGWTGNTHAAGNKLVNINTAGSDELETLPRIGPKTAGAIIEYRRRRPFVRIEDIEKVPGIGPKTHEQLRPFITVN